MKHILTIAAIVLPLILSGQVVLQESFWTGTYIEKDGAKLTDRGTIKLFGDNQEALDLYLDGKADGNAYLALSLIGSACVLGGALTLGKGQPVVPLTLSLSGLTFTIVGMSKYSQRRKKWNRAVAIYNQ